MYVECIKRTKKNLKRVTKSNKFLFIYFFVVNPLKTQTTIQIIKTQNFVCFFLFLLLLFNTEKVFNLNLDL